jgi:hypothetical protein
VSFGVNADAGLVPDPDELMGGIVAELRALRRLGTAPARG